MSEFIIAALLNVFVLGPIYYWVGRAIDRKNQKDIWERSQVGTRNASEMSRQWWDQARTLSQAFQNVIARKGGKPVGTDDHGGVVYDKGVTQEELFAEYAKLVGAKGCPCAGCMEIQKQKEAPRE